MQKKEDYDAGNPKDVKQAKKQQALLDERFENGMRKICNDVEIRTVLSRFFDEAAIFHDEPRIEGHDSTYEHGRNAGRRSMGNWWLTKALLHDPDIIGKLKADEDSPIRVKQETER